MKNPAWGIECFARHESGATAVGYGTLVALITVAIIITILAVGQHLEVVFDRIQRCLKNSFNCGV